MAQQAPRQRAATGTHEVLRLIRDGRANTRSELVRVTGLSRSTLMQRVESLRADGLIVSGDDLASMGGRPPGSLIFNARAGYVLAADCGVTQTHTAVADLDGTLLIEELADHPVADGPERFLTWLEGRLRAHLAEAGIGLDEIRGLGLGLPGPVEHATGRPRNPPIMPGWDNYPVAERLSAAFGVPAVIDNDVNMMALGEHRRAQREAQDMIFVKVSTGIGAGLVLRGEIHRGAHGAAGDIGHIYVEGHDDTLCNCGNIGCLEAVASGRALAQRMGWDDQSGGVGKVVRDVEHGRAEAIAAVRQAGREIGGVLAALVNITDPDVIVIGGQLAEAEQPLIAGMLEVVYRRSLPLATHNLRITKSELREKAGVVGAALMIVETLLAPDADSGAPNDGPRTSLVST